MTQLFLEVKADTNDADYVTERSEIDQETLDKLMPLITAIRNCKKGHNWNTSDYRRDNEQSPTEMYAEFTKPDNDWENDLVVLFRDYVPYGQHGVHTIEDIRLIKVVLDKSLLRNF